MIISFENQVDPYVGISDDLQVYIKPKADVRGYGSATDNEVAVSLLYELRSKMKESDKLIVDVLVQSLSGVTEVCHFRPQLLSPLLTSVWVGV